MSRHAHVFPDAPWSGTIADGSIPAMHHRAMRFGLAVHIVFSDNALKPLPLGLANHVDDIARCELADFEVDGAFQGSPVRKTKFPHELFRIRTALFKMAEKRAGDALFLLRIKADLHGGITVAFGGLNLRDGITARFYNSNGGRLALVIIDAGHTD